MKKDIDSEILKLLSREKNLYGNPIAERLHISRDTANKHLWYLEAKGMIEYILIGRAKVWSLAK